MLVMMQETGHSVKSRGPSAPEPMTDGEGGVSLGKLKDEVYLLQGALRDIAQLVVDDADRQDGEEHEKPQSIFLRSSGLLRSPYRYCV